MLTSATDRSSRIGYRRSRGREVLRRDSADDLGRGDHLRTTDKRRRRRVHPLQCRLDVAVPTPPSVTKALRRVSSWYDSWRLRARKRLPPRRNPPTVQSLRFHALFCPHCRRESDERGPGKPFGVRRPGRGAAYRRLRPHRLRAIRHEERARITISDTCSMRSSEIFVGCASSHSATRSPCTKVHRSLATP